MDTSDPQIKFDENGVCNHCHQYDFLLSQVPADKEAALHHMLSTVKKEGKGKRYDCILGLSGGVDSSYVAHLASQWGLRPLAVHFDSGWNSNLAVTNIERIVKSLNLDLFTFVCNWEEMKDLQLAFFRSSVANQDIPQDHGFYSALYKVASEQGVHYILSGSNFATEGILPTSWGYDAKDSRHIEGDYRLFGKGKLKDYPRRGFWRAYVLDAYFGRIRMIKPLNVVHYNKAEAMKVIQDKLGWQYYGGKHYESVFTRFFQGFYLPKKFGFDKRLAHYSSLVVSGQMTRVEALNAIQHSTYSRDLIKEDLEFVAKKLGASVLEFKKIINQPPRSYQDFPNLESVISRLRKVKNFLNRLNLLTRKVR